MEILTDDLSELSICFQYGDLGESLDNYLTFSTNLQLKTTSILYRKAVRFSPCVLAEAQGFNKTK